MRGPVRSRSSSARSVARALGTAMTLLMVVSGPTGAQSPSPVDASPAPRPIRGALVTGARMVADLIPGRRGSEPAQLVGAGDRLWLRALDGEHSRIWVSHGEAAGTYPIPGTQLECGAPSCLDRSFWRLVPFREGIVTAGPTFISGGPVGTVSDAYVRGPLAIAGGRIFFVGAVDGELWAGDGTSTGTRQVLDIPPEGAPALCATWYDVPCPDLAQLVAIGDHVLMLANDGSHGFEPWISDGTPAGTRMLRDTARGAAGGVCPDMPESGPWKGSCLPWPVVASARGAMFWADDGTHGLEPWWTDGTSRGTHRILDLRPGRRSSTPGATGSMAPLGDGMVFLADDGRGPALWSTDGTRRGTVRLLGLSRPAPGADPVLDLWGAIASAGALYFPYDDGTHGLELWRTDGTRGGTTMVVDLEPGPDGSSPAHLVATDQGLAFTTVDTDVAGTIWRSDGTAAGTLPVVTTAPYADVSRRCGSEDRTPKCDAGEPDWLTAVGPRLFFTANDGVHGRELWAVDPPTPSGSPAP